LAQVAHRPASTISSVGPANCVLCPSSVAISYVFVGQIGSASGWLTLALVCQCIQDQLDFLLDNKAEHIPGHKSRKEFSLLL
jgi:hypothetical protein